MFERFTNSARRVVVLAQEESRSLDHDHIGAEHLLLGLLREREGVAARALASLGVTLEAVRGRVGEIVGRGTSARSGHIPFTPRAKKVLELALRASTELGHRYIGTEHILLGLVAEGGGVAVQVLADLGVDATRVREEVIRELAALRGRTAPPSASWPVEGALRTGDEMRRATLDALLACWQGDAGALEAKIGRLVQLAGWAGDDEQLEQLAGLVEIVDAGAGIVRLRPRPSAADG